MHEPFNPHCSHCVKFVYCFARDGPLADWGYCRDEVGDGWMPSPEELRRLEEAARGGQYAPLFAASIPFYQETDDGCSRYEPR